MIICYIDEVGMSSIAGPAVVCAVAIDSEKEKIDENIKDSKKLNKTQRNKLFPKLINELNYCIKEASVQRIEEINIHWARYEAMKSAVLDLNSTLNIEKVIVDGRFEIPDLNIPQEAIIKADDKLWQVGVASIIGKVYRDNIMSNFAHIEKYSYYDWENNAGYFVENTHKWGIVEFGGTDLHRRNFGYYKYCLFCRKKYEEFFNEGKTLEDYRKFEKEQIKEYKKSFYSIWKDGELNCWKPIKQIIS